jgi:hypothetical protein
VKRDNDKARAPALFSKITSTLKALKNKPLWRDRSAVVTIEFALLAPIVVLLFAYSLESIRLQLAVLFLERSVYDLSYRLKVDPNRDENLEPLLKKVIEERQQGIFSANDVEVEATYQKNMLALLSAPFKGCGVPESIVHLKLTATIGLFAGLVEDPFKITKTVNYFYINEIM